MNENNRNESSAQSEEPQFSNDPELDVRSEQFNPLKALTSQQMIPPYKKVPIYDNVSMFLSAMRKREMEKEKTMSGNPNQPGPSGSAPSRWLKNELDVVARQFAPHQGMVKGPGKKARQTRNLLSNIDKYTTGPMAMLSDYKSKRTRVKVTLRNDREIIGHVTGLVEIFDKHWNIVLLDVYEVWKRRKLHQWTTALTNIETNTTDQTKICLDRLKSLNIKIPETTIKSINRKFAECSRHIPQLLIRGEQIVIITPCS